jgi:hypothetical protein
MIRRDLNRQGLGADRGLRALFRAEKWPTFGFDEPWDDRRISGAFVDEAIEQLYGSRRRGPRTPRDDRPDRPGRGDRFRIR